MDGMKFPNKFVENIYKANKVLGKVESVLSIALLWALIVVCMIFISCRFIFHYSTPWADELARYLLIILAWFGGSYAASVGDHLEIDIVSTVLKKRTKNADKILAVIDRIGQVVVLGVMVFFSFSIERPAHSSISRPSSRPRPLFSSVNSSRMLPSFQ